MIRILLDSSYLLPTFGIEVVNLTDEDILKLRELRLSGKVMFYCVDISLVEVLPKVYREYKLRGIDAKRIIKLSLRSLFEAGFYEWLIPSSEAFELAFELKMAGHEDMIDNILYATAKTENMLFMTMDTMFIKFLREHKFDVTNVINHKDLLRQKL